MALAPSAGRPQRNESANFQVLATGLHIRHRLTLNLRSARCHVPNWLRSAHVSRWNLAWFGALSCAALARFVCFGFAIASSTSRKTDQGRRRATHYLLSSALITNLSRDSHAFWGSRIATIV
jgi:hypothetical protein